MLEMPLTEPATVPIKRPGDFQSSKSTNPIISRGIRAAIRSNVWNYKECEIMMLSGSDKRIGGSVMGTERLGKATILLIEVDEDTRRSMRESFTRLGYSVVSVECEDEALVLTMLGGARPDLIIINLDATTEEILETGRRIRERAGLDNSVPVVVIPYAFDPEREGTDVPAGENDFICYWADPDQLDSLVGRLIGSNIPDRNPSHIGKGV
jgi:CheY-like chemotaxis protein